MDRTDRQEAGDPVPADASKFYSRAFRIALIAVGIAVAAGIVIRLVTAR